MERRRKVVELPGRTVAVREITIGEARSWWAGMAARAEAREVDVVGDMILDVPLSLIHVMADLTAEDTDAMTPGDLRAVAVACEEVNPDFFALRRRILSAALGEADAG